MKIYRSLFSIAALICAVLFLNSCTKLSTQSKQFKFSFTPQTFTLNKINQTDTDVSATITVTAGEFQAAASAAGVTLDDLRNVYVTSCKVYTATNETNTMAGFSRCLINVPFQGSFNGSDMAAGNITDAQQTVLDLAPTSLNFMDLLRKNSFEMNIIFHQATVPDWSKLNLMVQFDVDVDAIIVN